VKCPATLSKANHLRPASSSLECLVAQAPRNRSVEGLVATTPKRHCIAVDHGWTHTTVLLVHRRTYWCPLWLFRCSSFLFPFLIHHQSFN
jgi:hypothetical protein